MTTFFQNLDCFFFLPTSILKIIDILFKMADFGDIDRLLEHCDGDDDDDDDDDDNDDDDDDDDDDDEEGNTSTPFQPDYDSTHIKQETIKFHK